MDANLLNVQVVTHRWYFYDGVLLAFGFVRHNEAIPAHRHGVSQNPDISTFQKWACHAVTPTIHNEIGNLRYTFPRFRRWVFAESSIFSFAKPHRKRIVPAFCYFVVNLLGTTHKTQIDLMGEIGPKVFPATKRVSTRALVLCLNTGISIKPIYYQAVNTLRSLTPC